MSTEKNVQRVKDFFGAIGRGDREGLLALVADDIDVGARRDAQCGRSCVLSPQF